MRVTPLLGADEQVTGVILLMDAHDGVSGPDGPASDRAVLSEEPDAHASSPTSEADTAIGDS